MRRTNYFLGILAISALGGMAIWLTTISRAQPTNEPPREGRQGQLPLTQVVLFNTGVGYFQREGAIEDNAKVDLMFPLTNINDLLKTLNIDDGGKPGMISFDGTEPVENSLNSFAINLSTNPTFGQILNQSRGARVEVTQDGAGAGATGALTGTIVGMEAFFENNSKEVHQLNLMCTDGIRRIPLERIQRLRFLDTRLEEEFRRALSVLGRAQNDQRRSLSLHLKGKGKRAAKIGYVVETPIWKASYRLRLDSKPENSVLQGWSIIQNNSEEDWHDIRLVLVSGRPITFKMDLAQPLYIPRPTVEPEVYASLRPPTHLGGTGAIIQGGIQLGGFGGQVGALGGQPGMGALGGGGLGALGIGGVNIGFAGGSPNMIGMPGMTGMATTMMPGMLQNRYQLPPQAVHPRNRLTYEELLERRNEMLADKNVDVDMANRWGSALANGGVDLEKIALNADRIGEGFRYAVEPTISLNRQQSAMVPVVQQKVTLSKISVFNRNYHPRFPFQSVVLKNTTKQHLQQGPVAVFEDNTYLGDSKLPDLAPDEERLVSFAVDLGVEVRPGETKFTSKLLSSAIQGGWLIENHLNNRDFSYTIRNRSRTKRSLVLEHPKDTSWVLKSKKKPLQTNDQLYRFAVEIPSDSKLVEEISESQEQETKTLIVNMNDSVLENALNRFKDEKPLYQALLKARDFRVRLQNSGKEITALQGRLKEISEEQARNRANMGSIPMTSEFYKRLLTTLDQLDKEYTQITKQIKDNLLAQRKLKQESEEYQRSLTVK